MEAIMFNLDQLPLPHAISQERSHKFMREVGAPNSTFKKLPMSVTKATRLLSSLFVTVANHSGEERYERTCNSRISREVNGSVG